MCGISGIVANSVERYASAQEAMIRSLYHRGPDGNGTHMFSNCLLGHNRLSIVDLETGDQPLLNRNKNKGIVFNGEIYGYKSIRKDISYDYQTTSDTEVIMALYEKHGTGLTEHLPGMFSFAIWDDDKQALFAARDRFGEKPFFYSFTENKELVFASEIKAICASGLITPKVNRAAISKYLNCGYTGPLETIYENVHVLPPAHTLVYSDGTIEIKRYWNYPSTTTQNISLSDAAEKFEELFDKSVEKQLIADVEVCAFLSGGLDSTSVVSSAHKYKPDLKTLAFGYKNESNELPYAKDAALKYSTDHYELLEESSSFENHFLKLSEIYDEPFADSSAIATYMICKLAADKTKVVLTGDAGDELLGGYTWWYKPIVDQLAERNTSSIKYAFVTALAAAEKIREKGTGDTSKRAWRQKYINIRDGKQQVSPVDAVQNRFNNLTDQDLESLSLPRQKSFSMFWEEEGNINDAMKFDIADYMPGDILVKTDRAAMANSLELRSPFLDVDLASFCMSMPGEFKITSSSDKILLREAMAKYWPESIKNRNKQGFGVSKNHWQDSPKMKGFYKDFVYDSSSALYNVLPYNETTKLLKSKPHLLHALFILSAWVDKKNNIE